MPPNRWLRLRHPNGFSDERFEAFRAHCRIWRAHVEALLRDWRHSSHATKPAPRYEFFEPTLSDDRKVATLPLGGEQTIGSRAEIENACSQMLWQYFPIEFSLGLEEGLTELATADETQPKTNWRRALRPQSGAPAPTPTLEVERHFTPSRSYMERDGRASDSSYANKKLCFVATDKRYLVELLYELSQREQCHYVKYSAEPRDGMYLGRCFMTDEALIGALWDEYHGHPKLMCSIQDDDFTLPFRSSEP